MALVMPTELESYSSSLVSVLGAKSHEIPWAADLGTLYQTVQQVYSIFSSSKNIPDAAKQLVLKVKELEKYVTVDVERHITMKNAHPPYYLGRILNQLGSVLTTCSSNNNSGSFDDSKSAVRMYDHLVAELQATFNEYGFCDVVEAIYDIDEATQKLEALSLKLAKVEGKSNGIDPAMAIATLHDVQAMQNGIRQAMTEDNVMRMQGKFDKFNSRMNNAEASFCSEYIKSDSQVFLEYLGQQFLLRKPFVQTIFQSHSADVINDHMIVPGTRQWVLERIHRWMKTPGKRFYYVSGKKGTGKTALCTAVCKLYNYEIAASHFFDSSLGASCLHNTMNGLIQAIASGMCHTMPEYINWLDDKYGQADLASKLAASWQESYRILLKEPIQDLYGIGKSASPHAKRRFLVIDGLDEMNPDDFKGFKSFTTSFMKDISSAFCLFVTVRSKRFSELIQIDEDTTEGIKFEDRAWMNRHIKDIEIYLSSSLGAVLSGEDEIDVPQHAKADENTLQNTVDELLKCSSGRFDYAIQLMEKFAAEFGSSGQFLGSVKKATLPVRQSVGSEYDQKMSDFASPYRAYRDNEGRSVAVRVMRQSQYLMDKTRVALIRGRHKIHQLNQ